MIGDLRRNVITTYKANASEHKKELDGLTSKVNALAKAEDEANKKRETNANGVLDQLGKIGLAYDGVGKIVGTIQTAMRTTSERMRLETAAAGVSIDRLSDAAGGLISRQQQLAIAAKLSHGAFELTEKQMITVEQAMRQLTREGNNQEETIKKVTDAVVKLEDGGLKDFGIQIKETHTDAEKFTAIMDKLAGKARLVGDGSRTAAEETAALGVSWEDATDKFKIAIGKLLTQLQPLVEALAKAVGYVAEIASKVPKSAKDNPGSTIGQSFFGPFGGVMGQLWDDAGKAGLLRSDNLTQLAGGMYGIKDPNADALQLVDVNGRNQGAKSSIGIGTSELDITPAKNRAWSARGGGSGPAGEPDWQQRLNFAIYGYVTNVVAEYEAFMADVAIEQGSIQQLEDAGGIRGQIGNTALGKLPGDEGIKFDAAQLMRDRQSEFEDNNARAYDSYLKNKTGSYLESTFGKLEEFSAYGEAFQMLSGAIGASMTAWIDGSESAGKAFKHFIADSVKALAVQMSIEALKHGAYAIGSLAVGDFAGASLHGKAALAFGLAAAAAAKGAKELGTTAGDANAAKAAAAGSSGGGSRSAGGAGGGNGGGDRVVVLVTGNDMIDETASMRQTRARRYVELGLGQIGYGVETGA